MENIYIGFVDTPGIFAGIIRFVLKQRYVHVVIGEDERLEEAYSVGRRNPKIPFFSGFEKEEKEKILEKFPDAYYRICKISCTKEQKRRVMEQLKQDYLRQYQIHYAMLGLPFLLLGVPFYQKNRYTCSSYVARVLKENGICDFKKHFSLVTPKDFLEYQEMRIIYEGKLSLITEKSMNTSSMFTMLKQRQETVYE